MGGLVRILLIADNPADAVPFRRDLERSAGPAFVLEHVDTLARALERLARGGVDVVVADLWPRDAAGLEVCVRLREQAPQVPVLVLGDCDDEGIAIEALRLGAQDYLVKGQTDGKLLARSLRYAIERLALAREREQSLAEAVRRQAVELEAVLKSIPEAVFVIDELGAVRLTNRPGLRLLGLSSLEPVARPLSEYVHHYDIRDRSGRPLPLAQLPFWRAAHGESFHDVEVQARDNTGGPRLWMTCAGAPLVDAAGRLTGAVVVAHDKTESREGEAERERLLAEMDATINAIAEGLVIFDRYGEIVRMNPAARRLLGYPSEQAGIPAEARTRVLQAEAPAGRPLLPEESPAVRALRGETTSGFLMVLRPSPERKVWVTTSAAPVRAPDGTTLGAVVTFADVSKLRELEEQREDFVRMISHDMRQPITAMTGLADLLSRRLAQLDLEREASAARRVMDGGLRMSAMIQDLVESVRLETGRLPMETKPVDLCLLVAEVVDRTISPEDRARINVESAGGAPAVLADPVYVERAVVNLLTNALKYSPPDRQVVVKLGVENGKGVISVADRGQGIPQEELPRVFERFYRAQESSRSEGLGLGLYIVRLIAEAHGGSASVQSEVGVGSTFSIALPLA